MRFFVFGLRGVAVCLLLLCALLVSGNVTMAQTPTLTLSPTDLSFGIPTGTSPAVSAPQTVTVNIGGKGSVTFSPAASTDQADFVVSGNSCVGTLTAPTTCNIVVTFQTLQAPGVLETSTLSIPNSATDGPLQVPLNGALGAIELFGALNVNNSLFPGVTWPNAPGNPVKTVTVNLSCPAEPAPTAVLSSTPDGSHNLFEDNTIKVTNTVNGEARVTSNVCYGGDANFQGFTGFPPGTTNCFQAAYEGAANGFIGTNPDLSGVVATYGIQPVNLQNAPVINDAQLYSPVLVDGTQSLTVELTDAGGLLGAGTVQLVTNCTLAGVTPGGTITGNPINANDPGSQTQTFAFDNGGGQNISFTQSVSTAVQGGSVVIPNGTIPIVTDVGIPQQLFYQLVAGTSAGPAVCVRLTGEVDPFHSINPTNYLCKGYLIQCQDPKTGMISGDACIPSPSQLRNILETATFSSPDEPKAMGNFLTSIACTFYLNYLGTPGTCAPSTPGTTLIGPGMLLGGDGWTCAVGTADLTTCTPVAISNTVNSTTDPGTSVYSAANCALSGGLANNLCPIDSLTSFLGAADPSHGGTVPLSNSVFVPVVNMPKPVTQLGINGLNGNGWVNSANIAATFTSNQANYPNPSTGFPSSNGFVPAPPYSVTYGISPLGTALPDTTYSVPTDTTQYQGSSTKHLGTDPFIPPLSNGNCTSKTPVSSFDSTDSFTPGTGIWNLHYFTTDCAYTEGLVFNPTDAALSDPAANWASFQVTTVGVDRTPPVLACSATPASPNGNNGWFISEGSVSCSATDDFSGLGQGTVVPGTTNVFQGSLNLNPAIGPLSTTVGQGNANGAAMIPQQSISDLAGNPSNPQGPFAFPIDRSLPTIGAAFSAPGNTFTVGQNVSINYSCADTGSGVAQCAGQNAPLACPAAPLAGSLLFKPSVVIDTSAAAIGPHAFNVTATDCAGNISAPVPVSYSIVAPAADLWLFELPFASDNIKKGTTGNFYAAVVNLSSPNANNVVITSQFTIPNGVTLSGPLTANFALVSCNFFGCSAPGSGTACAVSGTTITCNVGQLVSVGKGKGVVVKINIPVASTSVANTKFTSLTSVTSANDPNLKNNSYLENYTVTSK